MTLDKTRTDRIVTFTLVLCAIATTGLLAKREFGGRRPADRPERQAITNWSELAVGAHSTGPTNARLTIIEFADFQCPACRSFHRTMSSFLREHPSDVRFVYRHFPLQSIHAHARTAALASECAAEQGRFFEFHNVLFEGQAQIGTTAWSSFASRAGVRDTTSFASCLQTERHASRVSSDEAVAAAHKFRGTPALVINGQIVVGAPSRALLDQLLLTPDLAAARRALQR